MEKIYNDLTELIGNTPLLSLSRIARKRGAKAQVAAKLERFNPGGSSKDRIALAMIADAEEKGVLRAGGTIIEPTSGNTGVGLAWIGTLKGYRVVLTMPDTMSVERQTLLRAMGAKVVLTAGAKGMQGAIDKAEELRRDTPNAVILGQFANPSNPAAHERTTAEEILRDTDGNIDFFVAAVGTGGTLSGAAKRLKGENEKIVTVAVEPAASPVLSGGEPSSHAIQGIGAGFVPATYDARLTDRIVRISDDDAFRTARELAQYEGLSVGISSGAAAHAALEIACEAGNEGKRVVVVLPDTGERYLSTRLYDFEGYPL